MEAKLESVLASISNPGLLAGSGGLVTDVSQAMPSAPLNSGPGGAEGRGDMHAGVDPSVVANALENFRNGGAGSSGPGSASGRPPQVRNDSESAITRREPIVLPSIAQTDGVRFDIGGGVGAHSDIGPSRTGGHPLHTYAPHPLTPNGTNLALTPGSAGTGVSLPSLPHSSYPSAPQPHAQAHPHPHAHHPHHPHAHQHPHQHQHQHPHVHFPSGLSAPGSGRSPAAGSSTSKSSPLEWSGVKDPNAADGSPRLHSLPDNTLNPCVLLSLVLRLPPPARRSSTDSSSLPQAWSPRRGVAAQHAQAPCRPHGGVRRDDRRHGRAERRRGGQGQGEREG